MRARDRMVLAVAGGLMVLAAFWFLALAPKREDAAALVEAIAQAEKRRDAATTSAAMADQARAGYSRDYATVARLGKAVPIDDDVASLLYQLEITARAHDVDFRGVQLTPAAAPAPAPAPADDDSGEKTEPPAEDEDAAAAEAPADVPAAAVSALPPGAVLGPAGLTTMPFKFTFDGSFFSMQRFLRAINGLTTADGGRISVRGRLLTVDGFSLTPGRKGFPTVKAQVNATAYLATETVAPSSAAPGGAPTRVAQAPGTGAAPSTSATASTETPTP